MNGPTVFVLMDAFRWDYLDPENTPFLHRLASENLHGRRLVPGAGFCERSEVATGASSDVTLNFSAIGYDPQNSPFRKYRALLRLLGLANQFSGSKQIGRKIGWRLMRKLGVTAPIYRIPMEILHQFRLTEDHRDHMCEGAFTVESIFDIMREENRTTGWHYTALGVPNGNDFDRLNALEKDLASRHDLYLLYLEWPDRDGHYMGPESEEFRESIRAFDRTIGEHVERWFQMAPDMKIVLIGDHGMATVEERLDVMAEVRRVARSLGLKWRRDFSMFLDSTAARFWYREPAYKPAFEGALEEGALGRFGRFLDGVDARQFEMPEPSPGGLYGESLWWARSGVLIEPDYFHTREERVQGMHGYDPAVADSQGMAIVAGREITQRSIEQVTLRDLCPTLCDLMGIRVPEGNTGRSLLGRSEDERGTREGDQCSRLRV